MICILDVLGGRTSATRDTRLMCVIDEPVIPDTKASLSILYPSVMLVAFNEGVTHGHIMFEEQASIFRSKFFISTCTARKSK